MECMDKLDAQWLDECRAKEADRKVQRKTEECDNTEVDGARRGGASCREDSDAESITRSCVSMVSCGKHYHDSFSPWNGCISAYFTLLMQFMGTGLDLPACEGIWDIPIKGYVSIAIHAKSNYLGGDIISGMIDTELYKKEEISVFL